MNSENASERLYSKFESVETPAHVNVQDSNDELEPECLASRLRRNVWQTVVSKCLASRVMKVQFMLEGRMHIVTFCKPLTFSVFSKLLMRCPLRRRLQ